MSDQGIDIQPINGMDHTSCYQYDAHAVLYIYQQGRFQKKSINEPVIVQQVAITLCDLLQVSRPGAASVSLSVLPGICINYEPLFTTNNIEKSNKTCCHKKIKCYNCISNS